MAQEVLIPVQSNTLGGGELPMNVRVKCAKAFYHVVPGVGLALINPGDIIDVDKWMAGDLAKRGKVVGAKDDKLYRNPNYEPPVKEVPVDPLQAMLLRVVTAVEKLGERIDRLDRSGKHESR